MEGVDKVVELFAGEGMEVVCSEFVAGDRGDVGGGEFPEAGAVTYRPDEGGGIGLGCVVGLGFEANEGAEGVAEGYIVLLGELSPGVNAAAMVGGEFVSPVVIAVGGVAHSPPPRGGGRLLWRAGRGRTAGFWRGFSCFGAGGAWGECCAGAGCGSD